MQIKCSGCGAPLEIAASAARVECRYCGATSYPAGPPGSATAVPPTPPRPRREVALVATVLAAGAIAVAAYYCFLPGPQPAPTIPPSSSTTPPPAAPQPVPGSNAPVAARPAPSPAPRAIPAPAPTRTSPAEVPAGDILSNADARKVLEPVLLECMRTHGVHYLITRLGQGHEQPATGPLGPLIEVDTSVVDYRPTPDFATSPLGNCVLRAAAGVRTRAVRGAYLYFGLRNPGVADPLADAPPRLDQKAAEAALAALDPQARECARRHPEAASPGAAINLHVTFNGIDGRVASVRPFYLDPASPYGQCLVEAYSGATAPPFRELTAKLVHTLGP